MRQSITLGTRGEAKTRVCAEPGCGTHLAVHNPGVCCWEHGGWDGATFEEGMRLFLAALLEVQHGNRLTAERIARQDAAVAYEQRMPKLTAADRDRRAVELGRAA